MKSQSANQMMLFDQNDVYTTLPNKIRVQDWSNQHFQNEYDVVVMRNYEDKNKSDMVVMCFLLFLYWVYSFCWTKPHLGHGKVGVARTDI